MRTAAFEVEPAAFQAVLRHAAREQPREAVGLLAGPASGAASLALPLDNVAGSAAFLADPYGQYLAERRIEAEGLCLLAIYHSHPGGGAHLSAADLAFARLRDVVHVVIALPHGDCPLDVRAYLVRGDEASAVAFRVSNLRK